MGLGGSNNGVVAFLATGFWFFLEALIHYNIGKNGHFMPTSFPEGEELLLIVGSIIVCSALSTATASFVSSMLATKSKGD